MARRQLEEDVYNAESEDDYDPDFNEYRLEHYKVYGNSPMLMPDPFRVVSDFRLRDSILL